MTDSVALLFGVHAHQPVGNFPEVLEDAHSRCYRPFLHTVYRYPEFRFALHFSGWLLDYLLRHHPEDMAMLREMVTRGQVELFGGGDTEPVLAVIPTADRVGQVVTLSDRLEHTLGQRPRGAWLTERVWEATVVPGLRDAGIGYVTVDDYHFLCAGKGEAELHGYFTTEEDGRRLDLFPISEALRYRFPFSPAADAIGYLEGLADGGRQAAIYFDDIEKFGIWPETYQWVYERGWLRDFIEGVLASPRIRIMRYCDYRAQCRSRGVVYLPTTSYLEMNEWTLPVEAAGRYAELVQASKDGGRFERDKAFLRGGIWKNFFTRYPESNWMHKRMLGLSRRFHGLPPQSRSLEMRETLYQSQANDAYWHGLFGGLYLPHLRRAIYNAIVALEGLLDQAAPRPPLVREDLDLDGCDELFLHNGTLQGVLRLDGNAGLCELDAYLLRHNFGDTLQRRSEYYYRKIHLGESVHHEGQGIASAHDRVSFKHEIAPEDIVPDPRPRALFLDSWWPEEGEVAPVSNYVLQAGGGAGDGITLGCQLGDALVTKHFSLADNRLQVAYRFAGEGRGRFATEINLAMPSCDGPAGRFVRDGRIVGGFGQPLRLDGMKEIVLEDAVLGGSLALRASMPVQLVAQPHFSVSQSEAGFEKIMQAVTLILAWPLERLDRDMLITLEAVSTGG